MTWKEKLKTLTSKWHPTRTELASIATTGDYNDLINAPQGGGGGGFTPYIIKISESILEEKISNLREEYSDTLTKISKGIEFSQTDEVIMSIDFMTLQKFDIDLSSLSIGKLKFFASKDLSKYYPYKVERDNSFVKIYFYDLPLGNILLDSIPTLNDGPDNIPIEIVDGVYEYQYTEPEPEQTA